MGEAIDKIPADFNSIEEIQDFWDTHSTGDYWPEMEDVEMNLASELKSKLEIKKLYNLLGLTNDQIAIVENKAQIENTDSKQLIYRWILEHIQRKAKILMKPTPNKK